MKNEKTKRLGRQVIVNCILFALLISISAAAIASTIYYRNSMKEYQKYISTLLNLTAEQIDGDDLEQCIQSQKTSDKYDQLQLFMNELKNTSEIEYDYIVLPLNEDEDNNMMYVMTGVSDAEREIYEDVIGLGDMSGTEYSPKVAAYYMNQYKQHNGVTYYGNITEFGYMYTGMKAILDSNGNPVCVLAIDIAMTEIKNAVISFVLLLLLGCAILTCFFLWVEISWMRKRVTDPIGQIEDAAIRLKDMAGSAKDPEDLVFEQPKTPANDEIRSLANSLTAMSEDMRSYMQRLQAETIEKQRISSELNMAQKIQESALPSIFPAFPERSEFDIYALMDPAKEVGGDFYDFFFVDENHLAIVIADVSGKGVPAALFMMISKALLKNRAQGKESPKEVLMNVNNQLCENNEAEMFVTTWLGILEISTGKMIAANAGHEYPAICRADGQFELYKDKHGFVLAGMEGSRYREYELQLGHGDSLFLYTDGAPEATDANEQLYGTDRMIQALNKDPHTDCKSLLTNVYKDIFDFVGNAPQFDDITMVGFKLK